MSSEFTYLSFGAGVQSSALLVMSALGLHGCPKADLAVFADTGDEPAWVYEHLEFMRTFAESHGIPLKVTSIGCLSKDTLDRLAGKRKRVAQIPAFTTRDNRATILQRQCTNDYKLNPLKQAVREHLGYKKRQWMKHHITCLIGISTDEAHRMKPAKDKWLTNAWPLIDAGLSRQDCLDLLAKHGLPKPERSACIYCPFHSNDYWHWLQTEHPEEFDRAVRFDEAIRDQRSSGLEHPVFLHRSLIPLRDVTFIGDVPPSKVDGFGNECEGMCGV